MSPDTQTDPLPATTKFSGIAALLLPLLLGIYLLVTSTTHLSDSLWQYDAKRMLQLLLFPVLFLVTLLVPALRATFGMQLNRIPNWMGWTLTAIFGLGMVSACVNSTSMMGLAYSLADVALHFLVIAAAMVIAACRLHLGSRFDQVFLIVLATVGVVVGLQELIGVLAAWNAGLELHPRVTLQHFSWPRFYNQVQSWSLPVIAALPVFFPRKSSVWLLCMMALVLNWYVVLASGGRGTALAVVTAVVVVSLLFSSARKRLLLTHATGLLLGAMLYGVVAIGQGQNVEPVTGEINSKTELEQPDAKSNLEHSKPEESKFIAPLTGDRMTSSSGRVAMWKGSWTDTLDNPLLGIGPMNYACKGPVYRAAHPHSFPMQFLSEWGIPAFALLLTVCLFVAVRLLQQMKYQVPESRSIEFLQIVLLTGLLAAAIHACLSGVLVMPASQVAGVLICGWLLGSVESAPTAGIKKTRTLIGLTLVFILSIIFLIFAISEIQLHEQRLAETAGKDQLIPRLWQNGKVCVLYQNQ